MQAEGKSIIIVAGGSLDMSQVKEKIEETKNPFVIGADRGAIFLLDAGIIPSLAVGDFDSITVDEKERLSDVKSVETLNPVKDDTDFEHALRRAIDMKPERITIFGVTGSRLDQTMASINLLALCLEANIPAFIQDRTNRIRMINGDFSIQKKDAFGKYFSILPFDSLVEDISLKGFAYEVDHLTLEKEISRGVSNEIKDDLAFVSCKGRLLIMETMD